VTGAEAAPPRAIVFDLGRVLLRWRPEVLVASVLPARAADEAAAGHWVAQIFQAYGGDWARFDRGTIEVPELVARIAQRSGLGEAEVRAVVDAAPDELQPLPETVGWVRRLQAAGRRLHFLSNMPAPFARAVQARHDVLSAFVSGVFSSDVRLIKPEAGVFALAAARFGLPPAQLLLVDDHAPNVTAARAAGWRAVQFHDVAQAEAEVAAQGW